MNSSLGLRSLDDRVKIAIGSVFLAYTLNLLGKSGGDPDLWGFLSFGRLFWNSPSFPYQDVFSFVPTLDPWIYHEWLTGVLFYPLYQAFGAAGLQTLKYALALATLYLIYLTARKRGAHPLAILFMLALIVAGVKSFYSPVRPQIFTFLFFALTLYLLESTRMDGKFRRLWPLPLLQILLCNLHGGFLAVLGLIAIYTLGEALSRRPFWPYLAVLGAMPLVTLINPYGLDYFLYLFRAVTMPRPMITEWISIFQDFSSGAVGSAPYVAGLLVLCGLFWWRSRWWELTPALALGVTLFLGIKHIRHLIFFLLLVGGYFPVTLNYYRDDLAGRPGLQNFFGRQKTRAAIACGGAILAIALLTSFFLKAPFQINTPPEPQSGNISNMYYPVGAIDYMKKEGLTGKLLVEFAWGEYVMWLFHPHILVALDGRFETVYPESVIADYLHFIYATPRWRSFLEKYHPDLILIKNHGNLPDLIRNDPPWQVLYEDRSCLLFGKGAQKPGAAFRLPSTAGSEQDGLTMGGSIKLRTAGK